MVTSRDVRDVLDALELPLPGVDVMRMQDVAEALTFRDIDKYTKSSLQDIKELRNDKYRNLVDSLVRRAGVSFQWAATACRFIKSDDIGGVDRRERLENVLKPNHGLNALDALYTAIMVQYFDPSDAGSLRRLKSVLGRILCAHAPLPLRALAELLPPTSIFTAGLDDFPIQQRILRFLGSLLSGAHDDDSPIILLHASYREFLYDSARSGPFFVDEKEAHELMALACFRVMETSLQFNICHIPTSFLPNLKIPNIEGLLQQYISLSLSYASRNWAFHVSKMPDAVVALGSLILFFQENFLKWLEVMSLTQTDPLSVLADVTDIEVCDRL